ncbi:MAG: hypothetical protein KDE51_23300, partial [Anaerolineales bacterium]|nr:hypothetical protein [Anaerolineales bacterium]
MNSYHERTQSGLHLNRSAWIVLTCLMALMLLVTFLKYLEPVSALGSEVDCTLFYTTADHWQLELCPTDDSITTPMTVTLNGKEVGTAAYVRLYHPSQNGGTPQVAVLYASGFVRLKQNADPTPSIPFGTSFILGPAYWSGMETYHHNPQIDVLMIDTEWLPNAPLRMTAVGGVGEFEVRYDLTLPTPRDRQTRLHVTQTYTATAAVSIVPTRTAEAQGFKLVQASSMFINEGDTCDGGFVNCHDSNGIRFIGDNLAREEIRYPLTSTTGFLFTDTAALGDTWLDILHTDDDSWQGNTPNGRITLDELPQTYDLIPQGWISATNDPTQDNVGVWLHSNDPAAQTWQVGESQTVGYWLLAQDNPPDPWVDLGLRSGINFLDFEESYNCQFVKPNNPAITGTIQPIAGYDNTALQLGYDIGTTNGNWAQLRCDFDPPLNLAEQDHLRFAWRGDNQSGNSLEVGLVSKNGAQQFIFGRGYHHATQRHWWGDLVIPFDFLAPWEENSSFNPAEITAIFISVVKASDTDSGGSGTIAFDHFTAFNALSRTVQSEFESVPAHLTATMKAVDWLSAQQQPSGIL